MKKILIIFGTRPETIKLAPLIKEFKKYKSYFDIKVCNTSQHKQMLREVLEIFDIKVDYDLDIMQDNQDLFTITILILERLKNVLDDFKPDLVIVQGDTNTAFVSALATFYKKIDVAHIEAGLRSYDKYSPFPEEMNRNLVSKIAKFHFVPTKLAKDNLLKENISENIVITGNTIVDSLYQIIKNVEYNNIQDEFILVTLHRRENIARALKDICKAIKILALNEKKIIFPVHLNPDVRKIVFKELKNIKNITLLEPLPYDKFIYLLNKASLVITDSGGIQEEAVTLGKKIIVVRDNTERQEIVDLKNVKIVGSSMEDIVNAVEYFTNTNFSNLKTNIFGDGNASKKIVSYLKEFYYGKD